MCQTNLASHVTFRQWTSFNTPVNGLNVFLLPRFHLSVWGDEKQLASSSFFQHLPIITASFAGVTDSVKPEDLATSNNLFTTLALASTVPPHLPKNNDATTAT